MKRSFLVLLVLTALLLSAAMPASAAASEEMTPAAVEEVSSETHKLTSKAWAATVLIGVACVAGAMGMAWAIIKSTTNIAKQPEAAGHIRTAMMLGLVFIETIVIYALIVAILIIFVL